MWAPIATACLLVSSPQGPQGPQGPPQSSRLQVINNLLPPMMRITGILNLYCNGRKMKQIFVSRKQVEQSVFMIALSSPTIASSGGQPLDNGELGLVLPVTQQCYLQTTGPRIWQVCEITGMCSMWMAQFAQGLMHISSCHLIWLFANRRSL